MKYALLIVSGFFCFWAAGQETGTTSSAPLKIGDKIPAEVWRNIPKTDSTRLVIIDQWETSCASCIKGFAKMEALQQEIGETLQVVLVTRNKAEEINSRPVVRKLMPSLPSLTGDTLVYDLFPYAMVPQHIWVDYNGVVRAITDGSNATAANVTKFLRQNNITLSEKNDITGFDYNKPLFAGQHMPEDQLEYYSILIKGNVGLKSGNTFRRKDGLVYGRQMTNTDLLTLYKIAAGELIEDFEETRMIIEVKNPPDLQFNYDNPGEDRGKQYSMDIIVPVNKAKYLYRYMLTDLNRYTAYEGRIEKRQMDCWALVRTRNLKLTGDTAARKLNTLFRGTRPAIANYPIRFLALRIRDLPFIDLPVLDETDYQGLITLQFNAPVDSMSVLQSELRRYGLDLVKQKREINVMVLADQAN